MQKALVMCAVGSTPIVGFVQKKLGRLGSSETVKNVTCLVLLLSAAYIVSSSYNPFIYFAF